MEAVFVRPRAAMLRRAALRPRACTAAEQGGAALSAWRIPATRRLEPPTALRAAVRSCSARRHDGLAAKSSRVPGVASRSVERVGASAPAGGGASVRARSRAAKARPAAAAASARHAQQQQGGLTASPHEAAAPVHAGPESPCFVSAPIAAPSSYLTRSM